VSQIAWYSKIQLVDNRIITIKELSENIKNVVKFDGNVKFDSSKPDGTPRKIMDSYKINKMGWKPKINLEEGLNKSYEDFLKNNYK
jgi:GDP-L-fucose synthase